MASKVATRHGPGSQTEIHLMLLQPWHYILPTAPTKLRDTPAMRRHVEFQLRQSSVRATPREPKKGRIHYRLFLARTVLCIHDCAHPLALQSFDKRREERSCHLVLCMAGKRACQYTDSQAP